MIIIPTYKFLKSDPPSNIRDHLQNKEVYCKCTYTNCVSQILAVSTADSFQLLRNLYGLKIIISSGYRCQLHNKLVGGLDDSYHKLGLALDLLPYNGRGDLDKLELLAKECFDVVIRYETFIHCHNLK